jgi:hypothetical protein
MSGVPLRQFGTKDGRAVCEIGLRGPRFVAGAKGRLTDRPVPTDGGARWRPGRPAWTDGGAAVCAGFGSHWAAAPRSSSLDRWGNTSEEERLLKIALLEPPNDPYLAVL